MIDEHADVVHDVERLLRQLTIELRRRGRAILTDFEITPAQFEALVMAEDAPRLTVGDLGAKLGLAYSTVTDLIDRLERHGYVERIRDVSDKRMVRVGVMEKGQALIEEVLLARRLYLAKILSVMSEDKRLVFVEVLNVLGQQLHDNHVNM